MPRDTAPSATSDARPGSALPNSAAMAAMVLGLIGLAGWSLDLVVLRTFLSGEIAIQPLTALSLVVAGGALLLVERRASPRVGIVLALLLLLFAGQALFQFIGRIEIGTDYALFPDRVAAQGDSRAYPGRMAVVTAVSFVLASACLVLAPRSGRLVGLFHSVAATSILILSVVVLLGYLFGATPLPTMLGLANVALPTAIGLFVLAVGLLATRPKSGWVGLLLADSIGGSAARRLLPVIVIVPIAITWLALQGSKLGFYTAPLSLALMTTLSVLLLSALTVWAASRFDALDAVRRTEAALRESERRLREYEAKLILVARASTLGAMGTTLAHELNQPLGAAGNYLAAAMRLLGQLPDEPGGVREALEGAQASTQRAADIIRRLRGFITSGGVDRAPHSLARIVEDAFTLSEVGGQLEGVETRFDIDPALGPVLCDPVQIQLVLLNLIRNAVEAMADSPRRLIAITVCRHPGRDGEPDMAELVFADSGPGFGPAGPGRLFTSFHSDKPGGMGIGLSISETIVSAHNGRIWAEDAGQGAVFRFTLPLAVPRSV